MWSMRRKEFWRLKVKSKKANKANVIKKEHQTMNTYTLKELCSQNGSKNIISHLLAPSITISLEEVEETRSYVVAIDNGTRYCITGNAGIYDAGSEYVLLTDRKPTRQKLIEDVVKQKKWIKHPKMEVVTPDVVIESWRNRFHFKLEKDESHPGLRKPQMGALHALLSHMISPNETATIVLPTGTGKTETMLSALVAGQCKKVLVTVPTNALRGQLFHKFKTLGVLKNSAFGIVDEEAYYPIVGLITTSFESVDQLKSFIAQCNVVITTMQIIDNASSEQQDVYVSSFSNIFVDEAHHIVATSWRKFSERFPKEKLVQFTATPFRNDGKRLDGKIIFNYPLRQAQEDGYYRTIHFLPVREYGEGVEADKAIAKTAIERLRTDLAEGFEHIMMARCETKGRAETVYQLYRELCPDLKTVLLYSDCVNSNENYKRILNRDVDIVVCVDMLGEGFDLPELKIAAFHDIRKSLPITLQFAGRFTRTSRDTKLGSASFVANLADLTVQQELASLYEEDADWNLLLADANDRRVYEEKEYKDFLDGFRVGAEAQIPVRSIFPKFSAVVYKSFINGWHPEEFYKGIRGYEKLDYKSYDLNEHEKLLVAVLAKEQNVEGIKVKDVRTLVWSYLVLFLDDKKNLLYINSSDNASVYYEVAKHVIGERGKNPDLIRGIDVFKTFHNIKRTKLRNVGLKVYLGKDVRFRMHAGRDVENGLSRIEKMNSEKSFVVGDGFENGEKTSIGASYKGRIWSLSGNGNILEFKHWCLEQGAKLTNPKIDGNQILKETLIPTMIKELPQNAVPFSIDWDDEMWGQLETRFCFMLLGSKSYMYDTDIELCEKPVQGNAIRFAVCNELQRVEFQLELFENSENKDNKYPDYRVKQLTPGDALIQYGTNSLKLTEFFEDEDNIPTIFYTDGSILRGNEYIELKSLPALYDKDRLIAWNWDGVDILNESQGVSPNLKTDSIQYKVVQELIKGDYDIVYDDDNAGEIADVITLKLVDNVIQVELYHLKFAHDGKITSRIANFYEVCGQAQKSSNWKHKEPEEMLNHLLRREKKKSKDGECSRIYKGTKAKLTELLKLAKKKLPMKFNIYIVQPGVSKTTASNEILTLLGVTESFLKDRTGIELKVISNE